MLALIDNYRTSQNVELRKYPFSIFIIIPPVFDKIIFPHFHQVAEKINPLREMLKEVAAKENCATFDLESICEIARDKGLSPFGMDGAHFTSFTYSLVNEHLPFDEIIKLTFEQRIQAELNNVLAKGEIIQEQYNTAQQELSTILSIKPKLVYSAGSGLKMFDKPGASGSSSIASSDLILRN